MDKNHMLFLEAVAAGLKNEYVPWDAESCPGDWAAFFSLAEAHRLLPLVYQAVCRCPGFSSVEEKLKKYCRAQCMQLTAQQVRQTAEFSAVQNVLSASGVRFLVVKGIVMRNLYPNPDLRLSGDEDLLVHREDIPLCCRVLGDLGYITANPESREYELPFSNPTTSVRLEVHRSLFPPQQEAYGAWNRLFPDVLSRSVVQDGIPTLSPSDHMLYLICHAFKHFLHSGFGIRQVCDMILYANRWGKQVDWLRLLEQCRSIRAEKFAAALFRIGWKYLGFSPEQAGYPLQWQAVSADEMPLLGDILQAGIYGKSREERIHSSNVTLQAVAAQNKGTGRNSLTASLFPGRKAMEGKYPYLRRWPILLPVAWTSRILRYAAGNSDAAGALRLGKERLELLKMYGILDENA